ncbi:hypothetical protein BANORC5_31280 [Bacteroides nordii]|nr:hypothetical protein BANORC5_31280 [Bacteroides nordii]
MQFLMKTLRLIGMAIVAIMMSVNFAACSDDDDDIDVSQLEGTWGLVRSAGWELCSEETEKDEWDFTCDPYNPNDDSEKLVIKKLTDNRYSVTAYYYSTYSKSWEPEGNQIFTLDGKTLIINKSDDGYFGYGNPVIEALTSGKLVLHIKYDNVQTDPESDPEHRHSGDFTETFTRME